LGTVNLHLQTATVRWTIVNPLPRAVRSASHLLLPRPFRVVSASALDPEMSDAGEPLTDRQKKEIAVWFLSNAPAGEIHYVAKGRKRNRRRE
jgi:hypothetical protein